MKKSELKKVIVDLQREVANLQSNQRCVTRYLLQKEFKKEFKKDDEKCEAVLTLIEEEKNSFCYIHATASQIFAK